MRTRNTAMKPSLLRLGQATPPSRSLEHAGVRVILLVSVAFVLGLGAGAFWLYQSTRPAAVVQPEAASALGLSEATKAVLHSLKAPVTIRFYALLDPASVPASVREFAVRVDQVLAEYERESKGRLKVTRSLASSDAAAANLAAADKIKSFNLDKGDACYLGLTVACQDQQESLPELRPEWEPALESDLTRALARVIQAQPTAAQAVEMPPPNTMAIEEVKQALPDLESVSVKEGTRRLREKALADFTAINLKMEGRIKDAEQRVLDAQKNGDEATTQAAIQQLQRIQSERTEKFKQIAAQAQARVTALEEMKKK